eukprot:scaffold385_cov305-Pinguiococcus_pyrenoidosus.AAC.51
MSNMRPSPSGRSPARPSPSGRSSSRSAFCLCRFSSSGEGPRRQHSPKLLRRMRSYISDAFCS